MWTSIQVEEPTRKGSYRIKTNKGMIYGADFQDGIFFIVRSDVQIGWKGEGNEEVVTEWIFLK